MIDDNGYRLNVGLIITNENHEVFLGKRVGQNAWQFPQGGVNESESLEETVFRELWEEVGLDKSSVQILAHTRQWMRYKLPKKLIRDSKPICIGQKQKWYLLKLVDSEKKIRLDVSKKPEFDDWTWVNYWYPISQVIHFKRDVYRRALKELSPVFFGLSAKQHKWQLDNLMEN